ncbi:MAG: hypothetical protein ACTSVL_02905 [Promethearchaeota archaeon]
MIIMKNNTIKMLISILVFCMLINQSNLVIAPQNYSQIKSSDDEYTNIIMEDLNDTLKFRINSSRDVTAFRCSYIVNHTNSSSFFKILGGSGDIYGIEIIYEGLRFFIVSKEYLLFYHNGGYLYNFIMDIYFINPLYSGTYHAGRITPEPFLLDPPDPDPPDPPDETEGNLNLLWIPIGAMIIGFSICGFFHPRRRVIQSQPNGVQFEGQNVDKNSAEQLERRRARIRTNRRRRNN